MTKQNVLKIKILRGAFGRTEDFYFVRKVTHYVLIFPVNKNTLFKNNVHIIILK